jgi:hypothetical protein
MLRNYTADNTVKITVMLLALVVYLILGGVYLLLYLVIVC